MRLHRIALVLASSALLLGGCGDGGSGSNTARQTPTTDNRPVSERLTPHPLGGSDAPAGYYEYLPPGYGDGKPRPLLVFLTGVGGNGDGSAAQLDNLFDGGIPELIHSNRWPSDRPFVVLAPQHASPPDEVIDPAYAPCDTGPYGGSCVMKIQHDKGHPAGGTYCATPAEVHSFLAFAIAKYDVDPKRVYLTGLSCGAYAAYEYLAEHGASQIAALVAIAGDARPAWSDVGCGLGAVPIWAFHGDADDVVAPSGSTVPMNALSGCPAPPRQAVEVTVYAGVDHDSWTRTYDLSAGHDIYTWLLGLARP
jgi:predicted peptidase